MDASLVLAGAVQLATPIGAAALGETVVERSGSINLGIEGMMLAGALAGAYGSAKSGWATGLALAALAGCLLGALLAVTVILGRANQLVVGLALTLGVTGAATYLYQLWLPVGSNAPHIPLAPNIAIPALDKLPLIGSALFNQSLLTYALVVAVVIVRWSLRHTGAGLALRAAGDDPARAALRGVQVRVVRSAAFMFGGAMAALGGAVITVGYLGSFDENVTSGRGYIALAAVIIGRWSPWGALAGAGVFAAFDSLAINSQSGSGLGIPVEVLTALPYLMTLAALVVVARGGHGPRALGKPLPDPG